MVGVNDPANPDPATGTDLRSLLRHPGFPAVVIVVVALLGGLAFVAFDRGDLRVVPGPVTTATSTTLPLLAPSEVTSTVPATATPAGDAASAVWPSPTSSQRFDDPVAAVTSFATDFVGFTDPVIGELTSTLIGTSQIDVRPSPDGPITTVTVAQLGPDLTWWVLGAATPNIVVDDPPPLSLVSSPVALRGRALAFEGTVDVEVRNDDGPTPIATGVVTGGGGGELAPFDGQIEITPAPTGRGSITFLTRSADDGSVREATVVRVQFAEG